uniref:Uncharacterized protein n=1 Tax=Musa acuminata subsp. malaccensis TaxID=214687 RepID=A0A804J1M1_MUSAM
MSGFILTIEVDRSLRCLHL